MIIWLGMLWLIDQVIGQHTVFVIGKVADALHLLEAITLLVWLLIALCKVIRKEWRDHHE